MALTYGYRKSSLSLSLQQKDMWLISMALLKGLLLEAKVLSGSLSVVYTSKQFYHWK